MSLWKTWVICHSHRKYKIYYISIILIFSLLQSLFSFELPIFTWEATACLLKYLHIYLDACIFIRYINSFDISKTIMGLISFSIDESTLVDFCLLVSENDFSTNKMTLNGVKSLKEANIQRGTLNLSLFLHAKMSVVYC